MSIVNIDASWCIENIELATEYFKEKQNENANLENGLNILRKYKKELDELYWQIRALTKQFNKYYNDVISTKNDLENLKNEGERGSISEELFLQRENQLRNKLTQTFQSLIESHERIRNKIPTVSWEEEINKLNVSAQKLYDEGKYNLAVERWNLVLSIDPRNQIALDMVEKTKNKTESRGVKNYCPVCGYPNERKLKYCTQCGTKLFVI